MAWQEWVFSGIGVAAIGVLGKMLMPASLRKNTSHPKNSVTGEVRVTGNTQTVITHVGDIHQTINHQPVIAKQGDTAELTHTIEIAPIYSDTPSVREIVKTIEETAPFMRSQVAHQYVGLAVEWRLSFKNVWSMTMNMNGESYPYQIFASYISVEDSYFAPRVTILADFDRFPRLRSLPKDSVFRVRGRISAILADLPLVAADEIIFE